MHGRDKPFTGLFGKYKILEVHQKFLAPPTRAVWGVPFSDRRPRGATRLPPGHERLRTADALRPGRLRNTWPARHPGQPRTSTFHKIPTSKTYGQPPTGLFQNKRPRPLGMYLSAEVRGPQTAPLTGPVEIPLTGPGGAGRGPCSETPPGGEGPASSFWTLASSFVAPIAYSKGLQGHDEGFMELFEKYRTLKVHQNFLAPLKRSFWGCLFRTSARGVIEGCPPAMTAYGLPTR